MSLDVYLIVAEERQVPAKIFIRESGATREISRAEWDALYPGAEPVTTAARATNEVYSRNITHNLGRMADAAGLYTWLWRPDELGVTQAAELIGPLTAGLERLEADPERFKKLNPSNGWGDYDGLVAFVRDYLHACRQHPAATVQVSR